MVTLRHSPCFVLNFLICVSLLPTIFKVLLASFADHDIGGGEVDSKGESSGMEGGGRGRRGWAGGDGLRLSLRGVCCLEHLNRFRQRGINTPILAILLHA